MMCANMIDVLEAIKASPGLTAIELRDVMGYDLSMIWNRIHRLEKQGYIVRDDSTDKWFVTDIITPLKKAKNKKRELRMIEHDGQSKCLKEWCRELGMNYSTVRGRIDRYGWSVEDALTVPIGMSRKNKERC